MPEQDIASKRMIEWKTTSATPVTVGDVTVTPQSKALIVRWAKGGWVWNRPVSILVEQGGQAKTIPVVDVTRGLQLGMLGFVLLLTIRSIVRSTRRKGDNHG